MALSSGWNIMEDYLGDCLLPEPALAAWAARSGQPARIWVEQEEARSLYRENPHVELAERRIRGVPSLSPRCYQQALDRGISLTAAYWPVVGLEEPLPNERLTCKVYPGPEEVASTECLYGAPRLPEGPAWGVICPFSKGCQVRRRQGIRRTKEPPRGWWAPVVETFQCIGLPVYSLGAAGDGGLPGTVNLRGIPLREAAILILGARIAICLDSWSAHVAGGREGPTLCLNSYVPPWNLRVGRVRVIHAKVPEWPHEVVIQAIEDALFDP